METPELVCNGVDATTGGYADPPISVKEVARMAQGLAPEPGQVAEAREWRRRLAGKDLGPREGIDPRDLASAGWGVVFSRGADPAVREALGELLEHRRRQAARVKEHYYRELWGDDGYGPGESKLAFLRRHRAGPGPADPERVPYYLMLVGSPEEIPYRFQTQLDLQYAVGRLWLDSPEAYARYARSVVEAENAAPRISPPAPQGAPRRGRRAAFFGVRNPDDPETFFTCEYLVKRVAAFLEGDQPDWTIDSVVEDGATKARLGQLLDGDAPDFLFTACHGMKFPNGHPRQRLLQGALLCQDWPGPKAGSGAVDRDHYFGADDLGSDAGPAGLVAFCYGCHSAGTPQFDAFAKRHGGASQELAPTPFVARLPQRLLERGALAVVGHVERSWLYSFIWKGVGGQSQVFEDALKRLFEGHPIGSAMEPFGLRYAELASELKEELELAEFGTGTTDEELIPRLWTATNDARNYAILGDPAVRLPAADGGTS